MGGSLWDCNHAGISVEQALVVKLGSIHGVSVSRNAGKNLRHCLIGWGDDLITEIE